jgi:hypothetical protein
MHYKCNNSKLVYTHLDYKHTKIIILECANLSALVLLIGFRIIHCFPLPTYCNHHDYVVWAWDLECYHCLLVVGTR